MVCGFKPGTHQAAKMKMPAYADGGLIDNLKARMFGPPETMTQKFARQDAERAAKNPPPVAAPTAAPAPASAVTSYAGMTAMQQREKAAGLKNGGGIKGPGTETSDSIPIMASKNEYMLPADTVKAVGGFKVLDALVAATHKPTGKPQAKLGFKALRDGGAVEPYVNPARPISPPFIDAPLRLGNTLGTVGSAVGPANYTPNFTTGNSSAPNVDPKTIYQPMGANATSQPSNLAAVSGSRELALTTDTGRSTQRMSIPPGYTPPAVDATGAYVNRAANVNPSSVAPPASATAPVTGPTSPTALQRMGQGLQSVTGLGGNVPTSGVGGFVANTGKRLAGIAAKAGLPITIGAEGLDVARVANDPNASGLDVAAQVAQGAGRIGGATTGAAAGATLGTAMLPGVGTVLGGLAGGALGYYGADKAVELGRNLTGSNPGSTASSAPSLLAPPASSALTPVAQATVKTDVQRGGADPGAANGSTLPAKTNPNQITATRQPNGVMSFSGGPNIGADGGSISYTGPAGFKPSGAGVTSMPAANFASASPSTDAALSAARFAAADRGDFQAVSNSYGGNFAGGKFSGNPAPTGFVVGGQAAQDRANQLDLRNPDNLAARNASFGSTRPSVQRMDAQTRLMQAKSGAQNQADQLAVTQRGQEITAAAQRSSTDLAGRKFGLDQQEFGLKKNVADRADRQGQQLEGVQKVLLDAKSTPEQRDQARESLLVLNNRDKPAAPDLYSTSPIPFKTDPMTGEVSGGGAIVTDKRTGDTRIISASDMSGKAALPAGMTRQIGTQNGKPVYEDKNGKKFVGN